MQNIALAIRHVSMVPTRGSGICREDNLALIHRLQTKWQGVRCRLSNWIRRSDSGGGCEERVSPSPQDLMNEIRDSAVLLVPETEERASGLWMALWVFMRSRHPHPHK